MLIFNIYVDIIFNSYILFCHIYIYILEKSTNNSVALWFLNKLLQWFDGAFDSIHRGKMEQLILAYDLPKETVTAIMTLYRNTKVKVQSLDRNRFL